MRTMCLLLMATSLGGCLFPRLSTDMSARPVDAGDTERALLATLGEAFDDSDGVTRIRRVSPPADIKRYMAAGFTLTDLYCDDFFRHTNAAKRHRQFWRGATNDVGSAVAGALGLVGATGVVVGAASLVTGTADKSWRNYDDSFVVAPELQNVRALVLAAQDDFRRTTFDTKVPTDYMTARSSIVRYAGLCTFLGMQSLLSQSIDQQRRLLQPEARAATSPAPAPPTATVATSAERPSPSTNTTRSQPDARANPVPPG